MLIVEGAELYTLRSPGGDKFTAFVDSVIRAQGYFLGLANALIKTNQRTNVRDGGVDTAVEAIMPGDTTGWFGAPTIWQYKAKQSANITDAELEEEVNKPLAVEYIKKGYGYRLCVCDNFAVDKQNAFRDTLRAAVKKINAGSPEPFVLSADDLASWTSRFPPIVMSHFRPKLAHMALHFGAWKRNILVPTRTYVPVTDWAPIQDGIRRHINFNLAPAETVFTIQGQAGVGKTRMVFETIATLSGATELTLYADDETEAVKLARALANDGAMKAILIVDECSVQTQIDLNNLLRGYKETIRIVAIDNTGVRPASGAAEFRLEKMADPVVLEILEKNFRNVPADRREAYAHFSKGFVRMAADLCVYHDRIVASGRLISGLEDIHRYYFQSDDRLTPEEKELLSALSLFTKVGFKDEVAQEWSDFCAFLKLDPVKTKALADKMHDSPGFVGRGGRYFYVTPEGIAQLAFIEAWRRWATNPAQFVKDIPKSLLESFNARVRESALPEVRGLVAEFFRAWAAKLTAKDLANRDITLRFSTLTEMSPEIFLPMLGDMLAAAALPEIRNITGESTGMGGWGPRRTLVWLAERLLRFPEYYSHCERILLRLALAESEPSIGNNATNIWRQTFRLFLSGTATPFSDRLSVLKSRVNDKDETVSNVALGALKALLDTHYSRLAGDSVIGGRIPPPEWRPMTQADQEECQNASVDFILTLLGSENNRLRHGAQLIVIDRMRFLLLSGHLHALRKTFSFAALNDQEQIAARNAIQQFLKYECSENSKRAVPAAYTAETRLWLESSQPKDFRGKFVTLLGVQTWHYHDLGSGDASRWVGGVRQFANTFLTDPKLLYEYLEWLHSDAAKSAVLFGEELGKLDTGGKLFKDILDASLKYKKSALGRGYLLGLLASSPSMANRVNAWLDEVEEESPELAYELFMAVPGPAKGYDRLLALYDSKKLPAWAFRAYLYGASRRELSLEQYETILSRLVPRAEAKDKEAQRIAIEIVGFELNSLNAAQAEAGRIFERPGIVALVWRLLAIDESELRDEGYWRGRILEAFAPRDPVRGIKQCIRDLAGEGLHTAEEALRIVIGLAKAHPKEAMQVFGGALLAEDGWKYSVETYTGLLLNIPLKIFVEWLTQNGIEAARAIARHLPQPSVDAQGEPFIHPLTEYVLREYESDDEIFQSFCSGSHAFQMYAGDIAKHHQAEVDFARKFLNHPLKRVREWAQYEMDSASKSAAWWQQHDEENRLK